MLHLTVNGQDHILADDIDPGTPLLWVLRDHLGLVGTKFGCGVAKTVRKIRLTYEKKPDAKLGTLGDVLVVEFP